MTRLTIGLALLVSSAACDMKRTNLAGEVAVSAAKESKTTPSNDIDALARVVTLSHRPQSARWQKTGLGAVGLGPTDWSLTALLVYSAADAKALLAASTSAPPGTEVPELDSWLPTEVREALATKPVAYEATAFLRSPLLHGVLLKLPEGERFVLHLHTM